MSTGPWSPSFRSWILDHLMTAAYKSFDNKTVIYNHKLSLKLKPSFYPWLFYWPTGRDKFFQLCLYVLFSVKFGVHLYSQILHWSALFSFLSLKFRVCRKCDFVSTDEDRGGHFISFNWQFRPVASFIQYMRNMSSFCRFARWGICR